MWVARRNAEELPACLRLILTAGDRFADAPKLPRGFEDIRDQQRKLFLARIDNMLSYWHNVAIMVTEQHSAVEALRAAFERAAAIRPAVGGFPVLAEVLRAAGVQRNEWQLPAAQSRYDMLDGAVVVQQLKPLTEGITAVPAFDRDELIRVLRADQAGETTFLTFLEGTWRAGVVRYVVEFDERRVLYYGSTGDVYEESYAPIQVSE